MNKVSSILFILAALSLFVGCSEGFKINSEIGTDLSFFKASPSSQFIPESDQVVSNCSEVGELCLYLKNPVFQEQRVISPSDSSELIATQKFSAKLTGLDLSGSLKSRHLDIRSLRRGGRLSWNSILEAKALGSSNAIYPLAASAYYWLNRAQEYLSKTFPEDFTPSPILVYVDDAFDGFSYEARSLHLDFEKKSALSADVLLVLFGEAQMGFSSGGKIYLGSQANHQSCGGNPKGCCKTSAGCSQALLRGSGDVMLNLLLPDAPGVGEFHRQNISGQAVCGRPRNVESFKSMTFSEAHQLCAKGGSTLALGMVYASVWAEVRKAAADPKLVDRTFLHLASKLDGTDTFTTVQTKISAVCDEINAPSLKALFIQEFAKR